MWCWLLMPLMPNMFSETIMNRVLNWCRPAIMFIMTRTFSKIYALASLRIGWAYASANIIDVLNRVRGPFNVNACAIAAGAAAMGDSDHVRQSIAHNKQVAGLAERSLGKNWVEKSPPQLAILSSFISPINKDPPRPQIACSPQTGIFCGPLLAMVFQMRCACRLARKRKIGRCSKFCKVS